MNKRSWFWTIAATTTAFLLYGVLVYKLGQIFMTATTEKLFSLLLFLLFLSLFISVGLILMIKGTVLNSLRSEDTVEAAIAKKYGTIVKGICILITDVPLDDEYFKRYFFFEEHAQEAKKVFLSGSLSSINFLPPELAAMLKQGKDELFISDEKIVATAFNTVTENGYVLVEILIKAEDAALFDIKPINMTDGARLDLRLRRQYGSGINGIVFFVKGESNTERYPVQIFLLRVETYHAFEDVVSHDRMHKWSDLRGVILQALLLPELPDGWKNVGLVSHYNIPNLLKIVVDINSAADHDFYYEKIPTSIVAAKMIRTDARDESLQGLIIKVTDVPEGHAYEDTVYLFDKDHAEAKKAVLEAPEDVTLVNLDDMDDSDLERVLRGRSVTSQVVFTENVITIGGIRLLEVNVKAEYAGDWDLFGGFVDEEAGFKSDIKKKYGKNIAGVQIEIVDQKPDEDEFLPVVYLFDPRNEPSTNSVNEVAFSNIAASILDVIDGLAHSEIKVIGTKTISTIKGPAEVVLLNINAESAIDYSIFPEEV